MTDEEAIAEVMFLFDVRVRSLNLLRRRGIEARWATDSCLHFTTHFTARGPLSIEVKMAIKGLVDEVAKLIDSEVAGYAITVSGLDHAWEVSFTQ